MCIDLGRVFLPAGYFRFVVSMFATRFSDVFTFSRNCDTSVSSGSLGLPRIEVSGFVAELVAMRHAVEEEFAGLGAGVVEAVSE